MSEIFRRTGTVYSATFAAVAMTVAQDLFEIVAQSAGPVIIREVRIAQYTDFADAASEILPIQIIRGFTTSGGTGGTNPTPSNLGNTQGRAALSTVEINNTVLASAGTGAILIADVWNIAAPWLYQPEPLERIVLAPSQRLVVRLVGAPADSITANGTLVFEEL